jgi:hypothetical protein
MHFQPGTFRHLLLKISKRVRDTVWVREYDGWCLYQVLLDDWALPATTVMSPQ